MTIHQLLLKYWGYNKFRPLQEEIIYSVMEGNDTLALMPTGGGKSLCYQIPALAKDGLCLVISPLIALMKDQVDGLVKRGISAAAVFSGMHYSEIDSVLDNAAHGQYKFLFLSPERLETSLFIERLKRMRVNLIAVDEAHCISQWGYDFRPPYLNIAEIRKFLPSVPILALTATATEKVVKDIQVKLEFNDGKIFKKSFERNNLTYYVIKEENKLKRILKIISKIGGTGIIYVRNRRKTKEISDFLIKNKISADYYHAGLTPEEREKKQNNWMSGRTKVIVSTNAFGMGIDKPDVRFVIHIDIPDTLEAYFQEAGRAGRDGNKSYAILLYENVDISDLEKYFQTAFPPIDEIKKVYNLLGNFLNIPIGIGKESTFEFNINEFCESYSLKLIETFNSLKILEKDGYLMLSEAMKLPSKIQFIINNNELYRFQVENELYDKFIKAILRIYGGVFNGFISIDENFISKKTGLKEEEIVKFLKKLEKHEILSYIPKTDKPKITYVCERLNEKDLYLSDDTYKHRKETAAKRLKAIKEYVTSITKCRSLHLLEYFDDYSAKRCGSCDVCIERNKISLSELEFDIIIKEIKPLLQKKPCNIQELADKFQNIDEDKIIKAIQWLMDNDKISYSSDNLLIWN